MKSPHGTEQRSLCAATAAGLQIENSRTATKAPGDADEQINITAYNTHSMFLYTFGILYFSNYLFNLA